MFSHFASTHLFDKKSINTKCYYWHFFLITVLLHELAVCGEKYSPFFYFSYNIRIYTTFFKHAGFCSPNCITCDPINLKLFKTCNCLCIVKASSRYYTATLPATANHTGWHSKLCKKLTVNYEKTATTYPIRSSVSFNCCNCSNCSNV